MREMYGNKIFEGNYPDKFRCQPGNTRTNITGHCPMVEVLHPVSGVVLANVGVPTLADSGMGGSKRTREDASTSLCGIHLFKKSSFWGTSVLTCTEEGVAAIQRISYQDKEGDDNMDVQCLPLLATISETSLTYCCVNMSWFFNIIIMFV